METPARLTRFLTPQSTCKSLELLELASVQIPFMEQRKRDATEGANKDTVRSPSPDAEVAS